MEDELQQTLRLFQSEYNRSIEEAFAQTLSEKENLRLFFIHENQAYTDGRSIVVDPGYGDVFADAEGLQRAEDYMGIAHEFSQSPWNALRVITRGQTIHECLHLLYTNFPLDALKDARSTTRVRRRTLGTIANIIEDAFIEAAGCSVFDNLEFFLLFERLACLFANSKAEGTVQQQFAQALPEGSLEAPQREQLDRLLDYLNYMAGFLLYPMLELGEPPEDIADYVAATRQLFLDGSVCGQPDERFAYSQQIFDCIEPLIPITEADLEPAFAQLERWLPGDKTHNGNAPTMAQVEQKGKSAQITRRLTTDLEGKPLPKPDFQQQVQQLVQAYASQQEEALEIPLMQPQVTTWMGEEFDCQSIHHGIALEEIRPRPDLKYKKAYQNIYHKYRIHINNYNSRFAQLLQAPVIQREEKKRFGSGISSRYLGDPKKRYWYRNIQELGVPELSVLLLIDGSGSMGGQLRQSAMVASVILHEVLKAQGIAHAIVEHRAIYGKPLVQHTILVDFAGKEQEKYNLMTLDADHGTREGLSLYWAEQYMLRRGDDAQRLMIVLSDGCPAHKAGGNAFYYPPVSTQDTANAVARLSARGTNIIAVALADCYEDLCEIYPTVIACSDLARLPAQLLGIVSRQLAKG